jgi:hypothetical protein
MNTGMHVGVQAGLGVKLGRLLAADRHVVDQDLGPGVSQDAGHVHRLVAGDDEPLVLRVGGHVRTNAVEDRPHLHDRVAPGAAGQFEEQLGVVRRGEQGLVQRPADLAGVDVERRHDRHVAGQVAAQVPVHQAERFPVAGRTARSCRLPIQVRPLDERTGTVAHARNRDFYAWHSRPHSP